MACFLSSQRADHFTRTRPLRVPLFEPCHIGPCSHKHPRHRQAVSVLAMHRPNTLAHAVSARNQPTDNSQLKTRRIPSELSIVKGDQSGKPAPERQKRCMLLAVSWPHSKENREGAQPGGDGGRRRAHKRRSRPQVSLSLAFRTLCCHHPFPPVVCSPTPWLFPPCHPRSRCNGRPQHCRDGCVAFGGGKQKG